MPANYSNCSLCPYFNQQHLTGINSIYSIQNPTPLSMDIGSNADTLLIFQAPGVDEWTGNTVSGNRIPIDSQNSHSAAARMRNSMQRNVVQRTNYDITEAVQCFPGKRNNGRDKKPSSISQRCCLQHLIADLSQKQYNKIVAFGKVAYKSAMLAVNTVNHLKLGITQPQPTFAQHPSSGVDKTTLDSSY